MSTSLEIARFYELHKQGAITKEEFETQKQSLLKSSASNQSLNTKPSSSKRIPRYLIDYPHFILYGFALCLYLTLVFFCFDSIGYGKDWRLGSYSRFYSPFDEDRIPMFGLPSAPFFLLSEMFMGLFILYLPLLTFSREISKENRYSTTGHGVFNILLFIGLGWVPFWNRMEYDYSGDVRMILEAIDPWALFVSTAYAQGALPESKWTYDADVYMLLHIIFPLLSLQIYLFRLRSHLLKISKDTSTPFTINPLLLFLFSVLYLKYKIDSWHRSVSTG